MSTSARPRLFELLDGSQPCAQTDPELFFPDKGESPATAKQLCQDCPLIRDCLAYGLRFKVFGVWGGTTDQDRRALRAKYGIQPELITVSDYLVNIFARPPLFDIDDSED